MSKPDWKYRIIRWQDRVWVLQENKWPRALWRAVAFELEHLQYDKIDEVELARLKEAARDQ